MREPGKFLWVVILISFLAGNDPAWGGDEIKRGLFSRLKILCLRAFESLLLSPRGHTVHHATVNGASEIKIDARPHRDFPDAPKKTFDEVRAAFSPIPESKAARFADLDLFSAEAKDLWTRIPQRKAESDMMAAKLVAGRIPKYQELGGLVIVDSGGAHSIAIAVELAKRGYQPILKMNRRSGTGGKWEQEVGAMKYFASEMEAARESLRPDSPVAIIMDVHRNDGFLKDGPLATSDYPPESFPTIDEVRTRYRGKIIWITEGTGDNFRVLAEYTPSFLRHYREAGVQLYQHGADPYFKGTPGHAIKLLPEGAVESSP
jgi:hypothetical protein